MKLPFKKKMLALALVPAFGLPLAASSFAQDASVQKQQAQEQQEQAQEQQEQAKEQLEQAQEQREQAQDQQEQAQAQEQQAQQAAQQQPVRDLRATDILGAKVVDKQGQELGEVQDLIVDMGNEKADYAILAFGGVLGFGEKLFAYPMERFQAQGGDEPQLALDVTEEELKNAPGFDKSNWPSWGQGGYRGEVDKHFGRTVAAGGDLVRMSELLDKEVSDQAGKEMGQIEDVVVGVQDGQIRFIALKPAEELKMEDRLAMIPPGAIEATAQAAEQQSGGQQQEATGAAGTPEQQAAMEEQEQQQASGSPGQEEQQAAGEQQQAAEGELTLVLAVEPQQLQNARTFQEDQWPEINSSAFQNETEQYIVAFPAGATATGSSAAQGQGAAGGNRQEMKQEMKEEQEEAQTSGGQQPQEEAAATSGGEAAQQQALPPGHPPVQEGAVIVVPDEEQTSGGVPQPDTPPPSSEGGPAAGLAYERPAGMGFPPGSERQESPPEWAPSPRN